MTLALGPVGVALTVSETYLDEAAEAERLGYRAAWLAGGQLDRLSRLADVVRATTAMQVGSSIISLDVYAADMVAEFYAREDEAAPGRLVIGLGGPQKPHPLPAMRDFLDTLDAAQPPVPGHRRLLAALGPRKLEMARDRSAGAILLLVTRAYIGTVRELLGEHSTLVVDQFVVADSSAAQARQTAARSLRFLAGLPGYQASLARMGFTADEIAGVGERLFDELVIWGDAKQIGARISAQLAAGADHVILHVLSESHQPGTMQVARSLAGLLPR
ncbi:MAG TPA: TIGR03620 family F420-dependent LLM class oxidoreductase [Streptosporangiaceae bacterium]|nr:TIGR03620 family F420-dependent LLM class oxidoreductase [Streptosporangiaceae bacterium]